MKVCISSVRNC